MASGKQQSSLTGQKVSPNSSNSYDECEETQWLRLPNNLELNARSKPSKKQRNKDKHRSFVEENATMLPKHTDGFGFPSNAASFQDLQRAKCNTATWLKDQLVKDDRSRRGVACDSEEVVSDTEFPLPFRMNVTFPVTHAFHITERSQELQRPPSRRSMVENEISKSVKSDLKKEAMRDEFNKLKEAVKQVEEGEREHQILLQQMATENSGYAMDNGISPSPSSSKGNVAHRDSNGNAAFCSEEEHSNKCNHLFEKMKQSEERLMALKMQETLLYHMQKKAENKLATFQAALNSSEQEAGAYGSGELALSQPHSRPEGQAVVNSNPNKNAEVPDQRQWIAEKTLSNSSEYTESQACWNNESHDIKQLHISLEHIRKRVQTMQQISASKNMTGSSSDDCDIADVGERVAAVEWERKKLKNKLVELQEKKKMNDKLLRELSFLKDAANTVAAGSVKHDEDSNFLPVTTKDSHLPSGKEKRRKSDVNPVDTDRKLFKLQATLRQFEGMMKAISPDDNAQDAALSVESTSVSVPRSGQRQSRVAPAKRDNVRKEQNSGFPARRHYEAEGRANEDADVPVLAPAIRPAIDKWEDHPEIQEKIRKIKVAQQQVKVINDIMASIQEAKRSGAPIPIEHLRYLQSFDKDEMLNFSDDESESGSEDAQKPETLLHIMQDTSENVSTSVKESSAHDEIPLMQEDGNDMAEVPRIEKHTQEDPDLQDSEEIENSVENKDQITKLQSHFHQLMGQMLQSSERKNEDHVRSSGEGGYTQNKKPPTNISVVQEHVRTAPRQDNLQLTRQNIANLHAHNQNCSSNFHKQGCDSVKKDNINNLSGKMGKLSIQNTMNDSISEGLNGSKDNLDSVSTFASEINQNRSHSNEMGRKAIFDTLKHYQKQHKVYHRNHDNQIRSNSSLDSEPFECSSSALAADTTAAATWGGSSTQENFEDENDEPVESVEEQDDDDEAAVPVARKKAPRCKVRAVFSDQFANMQQYIESVSKTPQERQENLHVGSQPVPHGRYHRQASKLIKPNHKMTSTNNASTESERVPTPLFEEVAEVHQQQMSSKFLQQLKNQIDQLNALCQRQLFHDTCQTSANFLLPQSCQTLPNACSPVPAVSDITQPYNQQLLLCLSQCYHALYMQQLEIQHLHRCIRHNLEAEVLHQANTLTNQNNSEGGFRPWCASTNPLVPSNLYAVDQIPPMTSSYYHLPMKPYSTHSSHSYGPVSGTRPVRAVIHPTSQESTAAQETLNNQVPPRTRANNFWDNFRSYSRQNLLSTSNNMKRNENVGLPVAPQVRQVHPQVPNDCINRAQAIPNSYCSSQLEFNRPLINPEIRDLMTRNKKPNSNPSVGAATNYSSVDFQKKSFPSNLNSSGAKGARSNRHRVQNSEQLPVASISHLSSVNLAQPQPVQDDSKVGGFSSICPTSISDAPVSSASEMPSMPQNDYQPDFLIGLFQVAQALKSDALRQKALKVIRDLATTEINDFDSSHNKAQNDHSIGNKTESGTNATSVQAVNIPLVETSVPPTESIDVEKPIAQTSSECNVSSTSEDLYTAAVTPLSKQATSRSASTGAVRKKPKHSSSYARSCSYSTLENNSSWENMELPLQQHSMSRTASDFPGNIVESIILDLKSYLPFGLRCKDSSPAFWLAVNTCIIDSLKTRMCITLSRKSLTALRHALERFLSPFAGTRFCDCESEFLKYVADFLHQSLNCFISTGQFVSNSMCASISSEDPSTLDADDKIHELCGRMPIDTDDRTQELSIKMPVEENDVFSSELRAVLQQAVAPQCNAIGSDNNSNASPTSEEDMTCECVPEAETEPEVEAGTEADLAEADQSPGQQGSVGATALSSAETWPLDPATVLLSRTIAPTVSAIVQSTDDIGEALEESTEELSGAQIFSDTCIDQEASLDNIPTKLCPAFEEELQRQLRDEQSAHLPISDDVRNENEFIGDNSCETDLANKK